MTIKTAALILVTIMLSSGLLAQPVDATHSDSATNAILPHERLPDLPVISANTTPLGPVVQKPDRFRSYADRLDFIHRNMHPTLKAYVILADELFKDDSVWLDPPEARFRLYLESENRISSKGTEYRFEPNLDADFSLPNLENQWKLYLRSRSRDSLTDREEEGQDEGRATRLGIRSLIEKTDIEADTGLHLSTRPKAYARLQWDHMWTADYWIIRPGQRIFYQTNKGFGTQSGLTFHRWLGRKPKTFFQANSSAEISQRSDGIELDQSFRLGKIREALEPMDRWTQMMGDHDIAQGSVIRVGMHGHVDGGESIIDGYRVGFIHREPIYKKWMFLSVNPDLLWENDTTWTTELRLRIGIDMLFWGSAER